MRPSLKKHRRTKLIYATVLLVIAGVSVVTLVQRRQVDPISNSSATNASFKSKDSGFALISRPGLSVEGKAKLKEWTASLPLAFEPNQGQADRQVQFLASGSRAQLLLTSSEAILRLQGSVRAEVARRKSQPNFGRYRATAGFSELSAR